jgi:hypothetical protein
VSERINWSTDFKGGKKEPDKGLRGIAKSILHLLFILCVLFAVYTFFEKTELAPKSVKVLTSLESDKGFCERSKD